MRRPLSVRSMLGREEGFFRAASTRAGTNCSDVLAMPPAINSVVPVTAALMAKIGMFSRGEVDIVTIVPLGGVVWIFGIE